MTALLRRADQTMPNVRKIHDNTALQNILVSAIVWTPWCAFVDVYRLRPQDAALLLLLSARHACCLQAQTQDLQRLKAAAWLVQSL